MAKYMYVYICTFPTDSPTSPGPNAEESFLDQWRHAPCFPAAAPQLCHLPSPLSPPLGAGAPAQETAAPPPPPPSSPSPPCPPGRRGG